MKMDLHVPNPEEQIEQIRAMFEKINQIPPPQRRGLRKFFHDLAERMSQPRKKMITKHMREAEPPKREVASPSGRGI